MSAILLVARKEAGELLLSLRGLAWLMAMAAALSVFALLLVSNTELSLLDNAQVVYDMAAIVTAMGALLALVVGIDSIAGERERGSLLPLLLTPAPREAVLFGKIGGIAIAWAVMFAGSTAYLWAVGSTGQNLAESVIAVALLGTPVVLGFGLLGLAIGAAVASARAGQLGGLIALLVSASPLLLGSSLRQTAIGQAFDAINPFSAAVNAYDAIIIDSQPVGAQVIHLSLVIGWVGLTLAAATLAFRRMAR
jgi:ABC-type transport system involved in multi-copper enzyme maturation permease subunit